MGSGKLTRQLRRAMEAAHHLNSHVNLYDYDVPAVVAGGRVQAFIYNSTERVKVVVRCEGCCPGRRHYRKATPKALSKKGALCCRLCMVGARLQQPEHVGNVPTTERKLIDLLWQLGVDQDFMYQVVPTFWKQPMDFYNYVAGYFVQVDGACHWVGMHKQGCQQVLATDFEQARIVLAQGKTLVRVHEADLAHAAVVAATLAAAQGFVGVVLSPAYAQQWVPCQGQKVLYTQRLMGLAPNLALSPGPSGVICIQKQ